MNWKTRGCPDGGRGGARLLQATILRREIGLSAAVLDTRGARLSLLPPLTLASLRPRPVGQLPFPLGEENSTIFRAAWQAVWHCVRAIGLERGDRVLVPALHQGPEVEALLRSGLECVFYEPDDALEPDEEQLKALLARSARALYLIHHLGFPQDAERWRGWCDAHGLLLIEDCSQGWLASRDGRPIGSWGDGAIFSLPATLALPDGGALLVGPPSPRPRLPRPLGLFALARRTRPLDRLRAALSTDHADAPTPGGTSMSLDDPDAPASALTCFLLPHIADPHIATRRRAHYELLLDALADLVPPPYTELPPGASPLMFPIESENKPALIERFRRRGVEAADLWPAPHPRLATERFPRAATRRARGIGLPVHQEASPDQLERVARIAVRRPSVSSGLRLEPLTTLDALGEEWDELAIASRNVFATREWLSVWREHCLRGEPVLATACRTPGGRLVAILPLYVTAEYGVRVLRFLGYGPSDQLGPICAPSDRLATARALRRFLADCPERWDLLIGHHLPSDQEWDALVGARMVGHQASPVIRFGGGSWDDFLASLSSNFRKEIRKDARRLAREHQVRYRLADNAERLSRDLDTLFELHGAQWRERSGFTRWERFHRAFAATALARGWLRFWLLEVDGVPVAAKYNFRFGDVEFSYQSARDVSWKRVSLGLLVRIHAMRAAFEEGVREYRLLRGGERHKYRFPTEDAGVDTIALARDPLRATALTLGDNLRTAPALAPARRWIGRRLRSG